MLFKIYLNESKRKPKKIWVEKGSEFYNRSMKSWLEKNYMEMYLIHNKGKSAAAERFIRTLKNKIYKYMTSVSKNVYIDKLDDTFNKYNNTYHSTIKIKPIDVKSNASIYSGKEVKNTIGWTYVISDLNGEEIVGTFYEKELQKTNQQELRLEKVINRKGDKLYVKWKCKS